MYTLETCQQRNISMLYQLLTKTHPCSKLQISWHWDRADSARHQKSRKHLQWTVTGSVLRCKML